MTKLASWKIWTKTNTEKKALEVLNRLSKAMGYNPHVISVEPHLEPHSEINGYIVRFSIELESENRNDQIIECIRISQRVASRWGLTGSIDSDPGGWSSTVSDSGIETIEWSFK